MQGSYAIKDPITDATKGHNKMDVLYCTHTKLYYPKVWNWVYISKQHDHTNTIIHTYKNTQIILIATNQEDIEGNP